MRKIKFISLVLMVIGIGLLHFLTPGHLIFYHDAYRRLSYFPIALGAIWFGLKGGVSIAALTSVAFIPHLLLFIGHEPGTYLSELTEIVLYLAAGAVIGVIAGREARLRDKYRLLSEKLKKSYTRLHEQTGQLIEAEEQLGVSQKLSALGRLSASLAHEIKNPLSSIKGAAEILLDEFPADHPKREFVEILQTEAARLDGSVNEVLRFSRGQRESGRDEPTEPLPRVIARVARLLKSHLKKKRIDLSVEGAETADDVHVVGGKISQVFLNILLNAIDAVPEEGNIDIRVQRDAEGVSIRISDNGPGVPETDRERIFDTFYTSREDGTGLGLPISRKIVASRGGRITVSDAEAGGACFEVHLPN